MSMYSDQRARPTRRDLLRYIGLGAGVLLAAACAQPAAAPAPTTAPAGATPDQLLHRLYRRAHARYYPRQSRSLAHV